MENNCPSKQIEFGDLNAAVFTINYLTFFVLYSIYHFTSDPFDVKPNSCRSYI